MLDSLLCFNHLMTGICKWDIFFVCLFASCFLSLVHSFSFLYLLSHSFIFFSFSFPFFLFFHRYTLLVYIDLIKSIWNSFQEFLKKTSASKRFLYQLMSMIYHLFYFDQAYHHWVIFPNLWRTFLRTTPIILFLGVWVCTCGSKSFL